MRGTTKAVLSGLCLGVAGVGIAGVVMFGGVDLEKRAIAEKKRHEDHAKMVNDRHSSGAMEVKQLAIRRLGHEGFVKKMCIDGTTFVGMDGNLVVFRTAPDDKPVACSAETEGDAP